MITADDRACSGFAGRTVCRCAIEAEFPDDIMVSGRRRNRVLVTKRRKGDACWRQCEDTSTPHTILTDKHNSRRRDSHAAHVGGIQEIEKKNHKRGNFLIRETRRTGTSLWLHIRGVAVTALLLSRRRLGLCAEGEWGWREGRAYSRSNTSRDGIIECRIST